MLTWTPSFPSLDVLALCSVARSVPALVYLLCPYDVMLPTSFCKRMGRDHSHVPPSQVRTRNLRSSKHKADINFSRLRYYGPQAVASPRSRLNSHDPGCRCLAASDNSLGVVHTVLRQESMATAFRSAFWGFSWPVPGQKRPKITAVQGPMSQLLVQSRCPRLD